MASAIGIEGKTMTSGKKLTLKLMVVAMYSFLICRTVLLSGISPFGVAFAAALPIQVGWLAFLGAGIGYGLFAAMDVSYLLALALLLPFRLLFRNLSAARQAVLFPTLSFTTCAVVGTVSLWLQQADTVSYVMVFCEAVCAAGVTYFSIHATTALFREDGLSRWSHVELASGTVLSMLGVVALMDIQIGMFSFGMITACILVQVTIYRIGMRWGVIVALLMGIAMNLYQVNYLPLAAMLLVAALMAGLFRSFGRVMQVAIFLSVCIFSLFVLGISISLLYQLINLLVGCALFLTLQPKQLSWIRPAGMAVGQTDLKQDIEQRLHFAAATVEDLKSVLQLVADNQQPRETTGVIDVYQHTVAAVCIGCSGNHSCWQQRYSETVEVFLELTELLKDGKSLDPATFTTTYPFRCHQREKLMATLTQSYDDFLRQDRRRRQAHSLRQIATEQLSGVSEIFWEVSEEIGGMERLKPHETAQVKDLFTTFAAPPDHVLCAVNELGRMEITIFTGAGVRCDGALLRDEFSRHLKRRFALPVVSQASNRQRLSFFETANFTPKTGQCQVISTRERPGNSVCGDTCSSFSDNKGNAYLLLSDGMGCGKEAAIDSTLACSVIFKLVRAGFSMETVMRFVNAMLQVHRDDETLVTIDLVKVDLYTGQAEFYKAGSAPSFARVGDSVVQIKSHSLPVGILSETQFERRSVTLQTDDLIVLVSDGMLTLSKEEIKQAIEQAGDRTPKALAGHLCDLAREAGPDHDDISVLVLQLTDQ